MGILKYVLSALPVSRAAATAAGNFGDFAMRLSTVCRGMHTATVTSRKTSPSEIFAKINLAFQSTKGRSAIRRLSPSHLAGRVDSENRKLGTM